MVQDKLAELEQAHQVVTQGEEIWDWGRAVGPERVRRRVELIVKACGLRPGVKALEIGAGTGIVTEELAKTGAEILGIDLAEALLEVARRRVIAPNVTFRAADVDHLPFGDNTFHAVVGCRILHHLDLSRSLSEIVRVTRRGGVVAFAEPNMANPQMLIQKNVKWVKRLMHDVDHETAFFRWRIARDLQRAGLINVTAEPFDFLHPWTPKPCVPLVRWIGKSCERIPLVREIAGSLLIVGHKR